MDSDTKKIIYQSSNGSKSIQDIVKTKIASSGTVFNNWNEWSKIGIGKLFSVKGGKRFKRSFDLNDFGIVNINSKSKKKS